MELLYSGKAKDIYKTEKENEVVVHFRNSLTAFNGKKKAELDEKGEVTCEITKIFFDYLEKHGVPTHYIKALEECQFLALKVKIVPLEVVVRNIATGSIVKRYGLKKGMKFKEPLLEYFIKDDSLNDPPICTSHIRALGFETEENLNKIGEMTLKVNDLLKPLLEKCKIDLVDFKLEFGFIDGKLLLADEISPDTCRFWDQDTGKSLDKDLFRGEEGGVVEAYKEVLKRLRTAVQE